MSSICIIPARRNSKRIKNKNIIAFYGEPMISYTIKAAKKSGCFDRIIVSTDCLKISKIAKKYGAEIPFLRAKSMAGDKITVIQVIKDTIRRIYPGKELPEYTCFMNAANPFIKEKNIKNAFKKIKSKKINYIFTASTYDYPVERALNINAKKLKVNMLNKKNMNKRSQDLKNLMHDAGQFYFAKTKIFMKEKNSFQKKLKF